MRGVHGAVGALLVWMASISLTAPNSPYPHRLPAQPGTATQLPRHTRRPGSHRLASRRPDNRRHRHRRCRNRARSPLPSASSSTPFVPIASMISRRRWAICRPRWPRPPTSVSARRRQDGGSSGRRGRSEQRGALVFVLDPTVSGADYSLGRILADAYPDQAKLEEIWKLYSSAVTGGSLLNLNPLQTSEAGTTQAWAAGGREDDRE